MGRLLGTDPWGPLCRYDVVLDPFAGVFGHDPVIVRRYRRVAPSDMFLRSFAELIDGRPVPIEAVRLPSERFNPSLSFSGGLRAIGSDVTLIEMRFAPLEILGTLRLVASFYRGNRRVAARRFRRESNDILLSLPGAPR